MNLSALPVVLAAAMSLVRARGLQKGLGLLETMPTPADGLPSSGPRGPSEADLPIWPRTEQAALVFSGGTQCSWIMV